jgi:hypothetical protein
MRAVSTAASVARHSAGALFEALLIAVIIATVLVALAPGSKPANTLAGTGIAAAASRGVVTVADGVFAGTTVATVNPGGDTWVRGRCYQNGGLVYEEYVHVDANNKATLTLGPTANWTSGAATCTAEELELGRNQRWHTLASAGFNVAG